MKKVLIFYSKTGSGHLRAAEALKEEIESNNKGIEVILHEGLGETKLGIKTNPTLAYALFSNELQGVYNFLYLLTNNKLGSKLLRLFIKRVWGRSLRKKILEEKPDLIITTHHFISPQTIKKHDHTSPFITIVTDLGEPHVIWYDKNVDKIITPTEVIASYAKKIVSDSGGKVVHIDYPLKNHFVTGKKSEIQNTVLVLGGGLGSGNIRSQVKVLFQETDHKIIVVCGQNEKLFKDLDLHFHGNHRVELYKFSDQIAELYKRADIICTKAGPGTIVEAATMKKPVVITSWVGMQEKENIKFVEENNLGIYEKDPNKLPEALDKIYKNYEKYSEGKSLFENGTKKIVEYFLKEYP